MVKTKDVLIKALEQQMDIKKQEIEIISNEISRLVTDEKA